MNKMIIRSQKLKNAVEKRNSGFEYYLRNILVNGNCRGTSGFIVNPANGLTVYVTTEGSVVTDLHYMYRYADSIKDFVGFRNRWANTLDELADEIVTLLTSPELRATETRF